MSEDQDSSVATSSEPIADTQTPWQRLHSRMIWVDALQSALSLAPAVLAIAVFDVHPELGSMWPFLAVAVFGVIGAVSDAIRWVFTRYRISPDYVELRTGVLVRSYRSVRRDRIRSVDIDAQLRHRLAGLRVVQIGAGQQSAAGESAFDLNAVLKADAIDLQHRLLRRSPLADQAAPAEGAQADPASDSAQAGDHTEVLARLRPHWVIYNVLNIWGLLMATGLIWGGYWLALTFDLNLVVVVQDLLDWEQLGWPLTILIGFGVVVAVGIVGMAINFFTSYWKFELSRVPGPESTQLRTSQGLLRTREVNRDERRRRGVQISEPVFWRWLGVADTEVITTGLSIWSADQPSAILPRGPLRTARSVGSKVLQAEPDPFSITLPAHPAAALRRRLVWATVVTLAAVGVAVWLTLTGVAGTWTIWTAAATWPVTLLAAVVAHRALGHGISGEYVILRSGLLNRTTAVLQRSAVSTVAVRESLLQRRLGLQTVSAMTAAGYGIFEAPDVDARSAVAFANEASAGLLEPFLDQAGPQRRRGPGEVQGHRNERGQASSSAV